MITDLAEAQQDDLKRTAKVCVVGAGAAGISMALKLEQLGIETIVLEGGGLTFPGQDELDLYDARTGEKPYPVAASRLRYLGGSTNHWGGWSRALDDFDFQDKPHFDIKGWPISAATVHQYYPEAATVCEIPHFAKCHDGHYDKHLTEGVLNWPGDEFCNKFFVFSPPTRFGTRYQRELEQAQHVTTFLHANATQLMFSGKTITGVVARSLNGQQLTIEAEHTILAMGGLENPRFMLNNQSPEFPHGVGNHADWLGRCFMDHPGFRPINLLLPEGLRYKRHAFEGVPVMPVISMQGEALMNRRMNNFCIMLNQKKHDETVGPEYSKNPWFGTDKVMANYGAQFIFEPSPCADSRVTLTDEVDKLGLKKLKLDWRFNESDFRSVEQVVKELTRSLGMSHSGRIRWHKFFTPPNIQAIGGGMHHGGTTRMSALPEDGVVDVNCAVHDTNGLYVISNSVFPHVGFSNPTITIVALALRLADHLHAKSS